MTNGAFDPTGAVQFDLGRGVVEGGGERMLLVPASLLAEVAHAAGAEAARAIAHAIGTACGERLSTRLGGSEGVTKASVDDIVTQLTGELAVSGVGSMHLERWGRAIVIVVQNCPISDPEAVAEIIGAALVAATDRPVSATALVRDAGGVRVLVTGKDGAERAKQLLAKGSSWGDVLANIQTRGEA
jgi:hypothetical protein